MLALERRSSEAGSFGLDDKFVVTRRGVAGGESTDVFVSKQEIVDFAPLGEKVLVLERRR